MTLGGDHVFGPAVASTGFTDLLGEALRRTLAAIYITVIYIAEHFVVLGGILIAASFAFARQAARIRKRGYRVGLAVLVSGVLYPSFWVIAEIFDWDAGLFN